MSIKALVVLGRSKGLLRYTAMCGHKTKDPARLSFAGWKSGLVSLPRQQEKIYYCSSCLERMTVLCAWCCRPIFVGEAVTAYQPLENFEPPLLAQVYEKDSTRLIGCSRPDCLSSPTDIIGRLVPNDARKLCVKEN